MHSWRRTLITALAGLGLACAASASGATGTVQGEVRGPDGPMAGAKVALQSAGDSKYDGTAQTDDTGAFTVSGVPLGQVEVKVYDGDDQLLVSGSGILEQDGEVITLLLRAGG